MPGKAYQSALNPYKDEIFDLRRRRPPVTYAEIARILHEAHHLQVRRETVFKFVRARCRRRKPLRYEPTYAELGREPASQVSKSSSGSRQSSKPRFQFTPSERYNLKRLPKEEAAAIRKKLEEEGH